MRALPLTALLTQAAAQERPARGGHPRPGDDSPGAMYSLARWILHESDYGVLSTTCADPKGWNTGCAYVGGHITDVVSVADGNGPEHSTGVPHFLLPLMDHTARNIQVDNRISITFSEMALGTCPKSGPGSTAEDPPCARLTMGGSVRRIEDPSDPDYNTSLSYMLNTHPQMKYWMKNAGHGFAPYKMTMDTVLILWHNGGSNNVSISEYLAAPAWGPAVTPAPTPMPPSAPGDKFQCSVCFHVYDAQKDGEGKLFSDLPDTWKCPACGAPKSAFKKMGGGEAAQGDAERWVHYGE